MSELTESQLGDYVEELQSRMVRNGDWSRIQKGMSVKLNELGFIDQVKNHAKETARAQTTLDFDSLQDSVGDFAIDKFPASVKQEILREIQAAIRSQLSNGR